MSKLHLSEKLYGACVEASRLCMVMEWVPMGSLFDVLHNARIALPWPLRWKMALDAAIGINALQHEPPILHRDIKSLNFLVTSDRACRPASKSPISAWRWCATRPDRPPPNLR